MGLFGQSQEDKQQARKQQLDQYAQVRRARIVNTVAMDTGLERVVIYAFLLEYEDGRRELYEGRRGDEIVQMILPKVEWESV